MHRQAASRYVFGLIIIILGLLAVFKACFGWIFGNFFELFWGVLILAVSISSMVRRGPRFWNVIFGLFGLYITAGSLGLHFLFVYNHTFVFAILLIVIGVVVIAGGVSPRHRHQYNAGSGFEGEHSAGNKAGSNTYSCSFGSKQFINNSKTFDGCCISCSFGRLLLDLRDAEVIGGAVIDVQSSFGTVSIVTPKNVKIVADVESTFGSFTDNTVGTYSDHLPVLEVRGSVSFGTVILN